MLNWGRQFSFSRRGNSLALMEASASFVLTLKKHPCVYPYNLTSVLRILFHAFLYYLLNCWKSLCFCLEQPWSCFTWVLDFVASCWKGRERRDKCCLIWRQEVVELGLTIYSTQKVCASSFSCELWGSRSFPKSGGTMSQMYFANISSSSCMTVKPYT